MTRIDKDMAKILDIKPLTNSPMMSILDVKAMVGIRAKGNCKLIKTFSKSFMPERFWMSS